MFDNKKLGAYIQFLRKSRGMTQSRLAEILGLSPQAVSNWERGESMPDIALLTQIARALGTTVDRMLSAAEDFDAERYKALLEDTPEESQEVSEPPKPQEPPHETSEPPKQEEPKTSHEQKQPSSNMGNLAEIIRDSVMGALSGLSGLSEELRPKMENLREEIENVVTEAGQGIEDALKTSRKADHVIINMHVGKKSKNSEDDDKWKDIVSMAPFASEETLDKLVRDLDPCTDTKKIVSLAPFLSDKTVDALVKKAITSNGVEIEWDFLSTIAPFCDSLDEILLQCDKSFTLKELVPLAPYLEEETIDKLIKRQFES